MGSNLHAQSGLTFNKVLNLSGKIEDKFHWSSAGSNCSGKYRQKDSFQNISDTFVVPTGKCWKIEFIDIDTLNKDIRFRYYVNSSCGFAGWTPGNYDINYNIYLNNVDVLNRKNHTPIWLTEGSQIIINISSSEFVNNPYGMWFENYTGSFGLEYFISILEFKVD